MRRQTTREKIKIIQLIGVIFILIFSGVSWVLLSTDLQAVEIMKLAEIKTGMKGEGKSIFKGTQIESFPFTVLGVIEKFAPDKNLIIVELESPVFDNIGIIAGMSGSPAYIDGKLIGAIAYGFQYSQKPIGGITPIEDILKTSEYNTPAFTIDISTIKVEFDEKNLSSIAEFVKTELARRLTFSGSRAMTPIRLLGTQRGFTPSALSYWGPVFSRFSPPPTAGGAGAAGMTMFTPTSTSTSADKNKNTGQLDIKSITGNKDLLKLSPADAVSIPLITGDFEFSSLGTVTHVDGEKVYVFGHPFFNLGTVDFPLHKSEILSVVPSYAESFKLSATRNMVGRAVQDRFSAVQCELGKLPYMIPLSVYLKNRDQKFKIEMVNHPLLTPVLSAFSMLNIFSCQYQEFGYQSIQVEGKIFIEGEKNIVINDIYSGLDSFGDFSNLLLAINFFLLNNKEKNIKIQKLDFEISGSETVRIANIENAILDKRSYLPGEVMDIVVYLRNERGSVFTEKLTIKAPDLKPDTDFYLLVADNGEMSRFDSKNIRTSFFPIKLNFLIRAINNLRKNNRLYFKLMTPSRGLFVKGYEYPNLPSSLQDVFMYDQSPVYDLSSGIQSRIKFSTITEYQLEFPTVVRGKKLFKLKIKERSDG
jgi:hypothetical protein